MPTKKTAKKLTKKTELKIHKPSNKGSVLTREFSLESFTQKIQSDLKNRESSFSLILGGLIIIVLGIMLFNFFNQQTATPSTTPTAANTQANGDVDKNSLPGKYTVKAGDTLYDISQKYYGNGYDFSQIAQVNNLTDENVIEAGQVLEIPKLSPSPLPSASSSPTPMPSASDQQSYQQNTGYVAGGTGGSMDETAWGAKITGTSYTVQKGDWLSKIAGRAYGNIYDYTKIASANHITNPNEIEPGTVLVIPQ